MMAPRRPPRSRHQQRAENGVDLSDAPVAQPGTVDPPAIVRRFKPRVDPNSGFAYYECRPDGSTWVYRIDRTSPPYEVSNTINIEHLLVFVQNGSWIELFAVADDGDQFKALNEEIARLRAIIHAQTVDINARERRDRVRARAAEPPPRRLNLRKNDATDAIEHLLRVIAGIGDGSTSPRSLPNVARLARKALAILQNAVNENK